MTGFVESSLNWFFYKISFCFSFPLVNCLGDLSQVYYNKKSNIDKNKMICNYEILFLWGTKWYWNDIDIENPFIILFVSHDILLWSIPNKD